MHPQIIQSQARKLRAEGKTYSEIQTLLGVKLPKSTLACWCQGVKLPGWYQEKIKQLNSKNLTKAQCYAHAQLKHKRELFLEKVKYEATKVLKKFNLEALKVALAMLYLGEGSKWKSHSGLMLGNADPDTILLYLALLEKCYGIKSEQLKCRISYRCDQNIKELERFWAKITGIPTKNFYKTKPDPRSRGKKTRKLDYKGVCVVTCAGSHIQLELEMLAKLLLQKLRAHSSAG